VFIPYQVDVPFNHRPVVNWLVVAAVVLVFALQLIEFAEHGGSDMTAGQYAEYLEKATSRQFVLNGFGIKGLFGHMWLHGGLFHLIGNLIFLWLFGNAVCSKIGNLYYLPAYILCGLTAAVTHLILFDVPMLGASGAINGMVGMYLVFFPENAISCMFFLLWHPIRFTVRSFWVILLWFAFDILGAAFGGGGVAYFAHIGGFVAGFGLAILLLQAKLVVMERDEKSILELLGLVKRDTPAEHRGDMAYWQQWQGGEGPSGEKEEQTQREQPPPPVPLAAQAPSERLIRFTCRCGQRIKVAGRFAGQIGRCPKCSVRLRIPGRQDNIT
jgi:membrane associated rhomboid family serine protease